MRVLLILLATLMLISGCGTGNVQPQIPIAPDARAIQLLNNGEFELAADEYLQLSTLYPDSSSLYQLGAADAYIRNLETEKAVRILNNLQLIQSDENLQFYRKILLANIALHQSQPEQAIDLTDTFIPKQTRKNQIINFHEIRANAFYLLEDEINAATELLKLDNFLVSSNEKPKYTNSIWNYLVNVDINELSNLGNSNVTNHVAWIELVIISKSLMTQTEELNNAINKWTEYNPDHPATDYITSEILNISERFDSKPSQIALLLPLSGIYERYSERIRDGFLSAWFIDKAYNPAIRIYNTDSQAFNEVYQQAVSDGAEFIVGPLDKDSVRMLAEMDDVPVRTLALNQVKINRSINTDNTKFPLPDLVQFGLPPEDEARQVAQRGILEGHVRALIITSTDEFGARVLNAFSDEWSNLGGIIIDRVEYNPQTSDFVTPIKRLLNIDSSEARISALRQKLGRNLSTNSRLREDVEFVFMVATNLTARQIVPHLRFFRAEGVPIYTISSVYTGKQNPQVDSDLNGVEFVDIPWLFDPQIDEAHISKQIQQSWQTSSSIFPRYYAFGVDAFRLISQIGNLALKPSYRYAGETGQLYMSADGIIHRNLLWARFDNGIPMLLFNGNNP